MSELRTRPFGLARGAFAHLGVQRNQGDLLVCAAQPADSGQHLHQSRTTGPLECERDALPDLANTDYPAVQMTPIVISRERVQDWINGAINPMLAGLKREEHFSSLRPFYLPNGDRFEFFHPLAEYVIDEDNLDDVEENRKDVRTRRKAHDAALERLREAMASAFEAASSDPRLVRAVRKVLASELAKDEYLEPFFLARTVEDAAEIGDAYASAKLWNEQGGALRGQFSKRHPKERAAVREGLREFHDIVITCRTSLKDLRKCLADEYGVRPNPVFPSPEF